MKKVLFLLLLLCAGYWGALNQAKLKTWWQSLTGHSTQAEVADTESEAASEAASESDSDAAPATPAPPPAPTPSAPAVSQAPVTVAPLASGFYYTRERLSQQTEAGIAAIPANTEVRVVSEQSGQVVVEANGKRVTTSMSKLTNDPVEIQALLQEAKTAQAAADAAKAAKDAARKAANAPPPPATREENAVKRQVIRARIAEVERAQSMTQNEIAKLQNDAAWAKANGRPSTFNDRAISTLKLRVNALDAERSRLNVELAGIPR